MKKLLTAGLLAAVAFGAEGYKVINKIKIGGTGGWDYVTVDSANRRLYVSHGTAVEVVDPDAGKVVGQIDQLHGVHGIAIAPDLGKGFITNGQSNSVTIFDLKTLAKTGEPATGKNPDAVCYEPKTKRIFTINHSGNDATAIDAKTNEIVKTFPLGPAPEFCVVDGAGKIYVNLEGSSEIVEIDAAKTEVYAARIARALRRPHRPRHRREEQEAVRRLRGNKMMAVVDIPTLESDRDSGHRAGHRWRRLRSRHGPGLQLQRRRHAEHRQAGERQVRGGRHRDHRARRAHHDRGREDCTASTCWPPNTVPRRRPRKARRAARRSCRTASTSW